ncbi:MAG TPA: chemotaxis protein CheX [Polyangiaceae bacterium]
MALAEVNALLENYLLQSTIELFGDIGVAFTPTQPSSWLPEITAILGFAGSDVAGSVALCTSTECLDAIAKLANTQLPADWLGELSNQLLGRFKRRLSPHGATFGLSTPVVILGERLRVVASAARKRSLVVCIASSIGRVEVWLEIEFRNGFELSAHPKEDGTLIEGEALLF